MFYTGMVGLVCVCDIRLGRSIVCMCGTGMVGILYVCSIRIW